MRRRVWAFIRQADVIFSFQIGLPSMIRTSNAERSLPRNFDDNDQFYEGCAAIPKPVPDGEPTKISYLISKTRLVMSFAQALKEIGRVESTPYERVLEIDRAIRNTYAKVPEYFKLQNMSEQAQDSLPLIFSRFTLANIHHKSLCVVHSRFLELARSDERYRYSRRTCLESAMALLRFQAIQHQDLPIQGKIQSLTKYQTSITIHDYLLAATIISAELCLGRGRVPVENAPAKCPMGGPTRSEMLTSLDISANIFSQMRDKSIEAYKASDVLGMLLRKLQTPSQLRGATTQDTTRKTPYQPESEKVPSNRARNSTETPRLMSRATRLPHYSAKPAKDSLPDSQHTSQGTHVGGSDNNAMPALLPSWLSQQQQQQQNRPAYDLCQTEQEALAFPSFYHWQSPSFAGHQQQLNHLEGETLTSDMGSGSSNFGFATQGQLLDLSNPVSTLWNLNDIDEMFD
jgi:hypothetical protein